MWTTKHNDTALNYTGTVMENGLQVQRAYQVEPVTPDHPDNPRYLKIKRLQGFGSMISSRVFLPVDGWKSPWTLLQPGHAAIGPVFVHGRSQFLPRVYRSGASESFRLSFKLYPDGGGGDAVVVPMDLMQQMIADIRQRYDLQFTTEIIHAAAGIHPLRETLLSPRNQ